MFEDNPLAKSKLENLAALREKGIDPYPYAYRRTHYSTDLQEQFSNLSPGDHSGKEAAVCGRLMIRRGFGKLVFLRVQDARGTLQVVLSLDTAGQKAFDLLEKMDAGDFLGAKGEVFATKKGEISVKAKEFVLLSKSVLPLPEKWHGIQDVELRHRKRHLDLIMNRDSLEVFQKRAKIISAIRAFMDQNGFVEVEIPTLQPNYGGASARPFVTKSHAWKSDFYLSISPELYLKRLTVGGMEKVYTICKNFRNEDVDKTHNPEFTMMEFYAAYWDYNDIMDFTEKLFVHVAKSVNGTTQITYQGKKIDLAAPWARLTMKEALQKYAKLDVDKLSDNQLKDILEKEKIELDSFKRGLAISELFEHYCEDQLIQPTFLIDHPVETTPLCKAKRGEPALIERLEPYINGWEVGNGYSELNDPVRQQKLFEEQADQGRAKGENHPIDTDYVDALAYGMPPTGGMGVGIDRLVMLLTDAPTIRDVILFPQMRPERRQIGERKNGTDKK